MVVAAHRAPTQLRGGDREHAGAAPQVGEGALGLTGVGQLEEHLQAESRRRVGASPEGTTRVDDDIQRALAGLLPRGPQPEPSADQQRLVEVLPAVRPVVGHLGGDDLDQAVAGCGLELPQLGQLALAAVDRVLDVAVARLLLDAVRRQHRQLGQDDLRLLRATPDCEADQAAPGRDGEPERPTFTV